MITLHIEHAVPDFAAWKKAFDSDPLRRKESGVRRHRVCRSIDDPNLVVVELDFDDIAQAQAMLGRLQEMWRKVTVMRNPQARLLQGVDRVEY